MKNKASDMLIQEIKKQCEFSLYSIEKMQNEKKMFWFYVQSLLVSSANISKILQRLNKINDDNFIKDNLNLEENSKLLSPKHRFVRNSFEHYDERIVNFLERYKNYSIVDSNIGPKWAFSVGHDKFLRHYDNELHIISFLDDTVEIIPLFEELKTLNQTLSNRNL